jgi:hypothetical protein
LKIVAACRRQHANGAETEARNNGWQRQDCRMTAAPILSTVANKKVNAREYKEYVNG